MTTEIAKTEIVNDNNEVVTSYLTIEEKIQALQLLGEEWFSSIETEKDIYLQRGRILREIINEELYKIKFNKETGIYEEIENREFEDFLKEDSKAFFNRHKALSIDSANNYQAFYLLYNKVLSHESISEPIFITQINPMTNLILTNIDKYFARALPQIQKIAAQVENAKALNFEVNVLTDKQQQAIAALAPAK